MQASTKNSWATLAIILLVLVWIIYFMLSPGDATFVQWAGAIMGASCCLLMLYQSVKTLMHDMS